MTNRQATKSLIVIDCIDYSSMSMITYRRCIFPGIYNSHLPIMIIENCSERKFVGGKVVIIKKNTGNS